MINLTQMQKDIFRNKLDRGFNTTDVHQEFCLAYGELGEAYDAYRKKKDDLGEELADVAIYLLGLSEMLGLDLETEIRRKIVKNSQRRYENRDGVNVRIED